MIYKTEINGEHVIAVTATDEVNSNGQMETYYIISTNTKEYLYTSLGEMLDSWDRVVEKRKKGGKFKGCTHYKKSKKSV